MAQPVLVAGGNGTEFNVRTGPNYNKHGKKAPSGMHIYEPVSIDLIKGSKIRYRLMDQLELAPLADADAVNDTGLPRRLICSANIPADAPKLLGDGIDGNCYQVVLTFAATVERLREWKASGNKMAGLFQRFYDEATTETPDVKLKERFKIMAKIDNFKQLGLPSFVEKYNGKPALITKSGTLFRGDDCLEVGMNTFRFAFITRKGVNTLLPRLGEMDFHFAVTVEARDEDDTLPEQVIGCARVKQCDLVKSAIDPPELPI